MQIYSSPEDLEKITYGVQLFYDQVLEQKDLRHFFFGISFERIMRDIQMYQDFVMAKPERYYKDSVMQTAPTEIQIRAPQFEEILVVFQQNLRKAGFLKANVLPLSVSLIEIIEESRAQQADAELKVWKPFEVTPELVCDFLNRNRTDARLEKNQDIYASRGFLYPFWIRVLPESKQFMLLGQGFSNHSEVTISEVERIATAAHERMPYQKFEIRESAKGPVLMARHYIRYPMGVPARMLLRAAKQFSTTFEAAMNLDTNKILKNIK